MFNLQNLTDKSAIGFSVACFIHCLVVPIVVVLLPSLTALSLDDEAFHLWMFIAVLPISLFALTMGCRKHKRYRVLLMGTVGLVILGLTAYLGHEVLGEFGEKGVTVAGASVIAFAHLRNHRLCQQMQCACGKSHASNIS